MLPVAEFRQQPVHPVSVCGFSWHELLPTQRYTHKQTGTPASAPQTPWSFQQLLWTPGPSSCQVLLWLYPQRPSCRPQAILPTHVLIQWNFPSTHTHSHSCTYSNCWYHGHTDHSDSFGKIGRNVVLWEARTHCPGQTQRHGQAGALGSPCLHTTGSFTYLPFYFPLVSPKPPWSLPLPTLRSSLNHPRVNTVKSWNAFSLYPVLRPISLMEVTPQSVWWWGHSHGDRCSLAHGLMFPWLSPVGLIWDR